MEIKETDYAGEGKVSNGNDEGGVRVIELKEEKKGMQGNKSDFSERKRRNTEEKEQRAEETKQSKLKID